jgi:ketosteroid isomerase-like protein
MTAGTRETVHQFWRLMATNDFQSVTEVLSPDFVLEWPQSSEIIRGPERFARMNSEYPSHGPWSFTIHRVVAADQEVVTDATVTDGVQTARAISFFTVDRGLITRLREFWPEPYDPPANRAHLVEPLADSERE